MLALWRPRSCWQKISLNYRWAPIIWVTLLWLVYCEIELALASSAILRKAAQIGVDISAQSFAGLSELAETEAALIQLLNDFERKIKQAAEDYSPAILAQYLFDLAKEYNRFYAELPIFHEKDLQLQSFRVALSLQTAKTIKRGMSLIGIQVPERM